MAAGNMLSFRPLTVLSNSLINWTVLQRNFSTEKFNIAMGIPKKPKRPAGPFIAFLKEHRLEVLKNNPGLSAAGVALHLGKKWHMLPEEEKVKYKEENEVKLTQYKSEMVEYEKLVALARSTEALPNWDDSKINKYKHIRRGLKHLSKALAKPASPSNPFKLFCIENKNNETLKELRDAWNNLPDEEREMYEKQFQKQFSEYETNLKKWEEKMLNEGKFDLIRLKTLKKMMNNK